MKQKILKMEEVLENGFILNHTNKEIKIPLRNYLGEIVNWAISSLEKLELLKSRKDLIFGLCGPAAKMQLWANSLGAKQQKRI